MGKCSCPKVPPPKKTKFYCCQQIIVISLEPKQLSKTKAKIDIHMRKCRGSRVETDPQKRIRHSEDKDNKTSRGRQPIKIKKTIKKQIKKKKSRKNTKTKSINKSIKV